MHRFSKLSGVQPQQRQRRGLQQCLRGGRGSLGRAGVALPPVVFLFSSSTLAAEAPVLEGMENGNEAGRAVAGTQGQVLKGERSSTV